MFDLTAQITTTLNSAALSDIKRKIQTEINNINGRIDIKVNASELTRLNREIKLLNDLGTQSRRIMTDLDTSVGRLDNTISKTTNSLIGLNAAGKTAASNLSRVFNDADTAMAAFAEQTAIAARRFVAFTVAFQGISGLTGLLKNAISESIAFNKEVVRIGQVSEDSFTQVKALGAEVGRLAQDLGVSSLELLKSGVLLKQAGLSTKDTTLALQALAKAALAPNFDDLASTTNGLIAAMQQFKLEGKDFESVLGSMNSVAGAFAVEASDLTEVVKKAGGVFASIKGDTKSGRDALNELLALFTSVRATTRESADEIGSGLRTIFGRLQRPATIEALRALGVQLRYTKKEVEENGLNKSLEDQFVGGYEAIKRISAALNQIPATDSRFAAIVEQIGGLRQLSRVTPLVQQFGEAQKALAVAEAGVNSLTINSIQAQESLANKITKVKENWLDLGRVLSDSSGFKSTFNQISLLSDGLVSILKTAGPLIPVLATLGASTVIRNILPAVNNTFFNREQYPGYKNQQDIIKSSLASGGGIKNSLANTNVIPFSVDKSNQVLTSGNSGTLKNILKSTTAYVQQIMPDILPSDARRFAQREIDHQIKQAGRANKLSTDAKGLESSAVSQIQNAATLRQQVNSALNYKNYLSSAGFGVDDNSLIQLRQLFTGNLNSNNPHQVAHAQTGIGHINTLLNLNKHQTDIKLLEARAERDKLQSTQAKEEADAIKARQQIGTRVDALGNTSTFLPAAESRLKEQGNNRLSGTGASTLKGLVQLSAEQEILAKNIKSAGLQELTYITTSNRIRQAYIDGVSLQIQENNKDISSQQAKILAEEKYEEALNKNTALLNTSLFNNNRDKGNLLFDNSLGSGLTQGQAQRLRIKNAIMNNLGAISLAGPVLAGGLASLSGSADDNAKSGGSAGFVASNTLAGGVTGGVTGGLITGGPIGAAVGALVGLTSSFIDAKKQMAEANLGVAVQKVADSFRQLSEGLLDASARTVQDITDNQLEIRKQAENAAKHNNIISALGYATGLGGQEYINDYRNRRRVEASKNASSTLLLIGKEIDNQIKTSAIRPPENEQAFRTRILNQALNNNGGFLRRQLNEASFGTGVPVEKLLDKFKKQIDEIFNNKNAEQANEATSRSITTFGLLNEAVIGAVNKLKNFNNILDSLFGAASGKFDFVKITQLSDNLKGSSIFDDKAIGQVLNSVSGVFGKESGSFKTQGEILGSLKQVLPIVLAEVRGAGNIAGPEGAFETRVLRALENNLGAGGLNKGKIGEALAIVASGLTKIGPNKILEESNTDVTRLAEQILEPAMKPFIESLTSIRKELENAANAYITHLNNIAATYDKLNQRLEVVDKNSFDLQRLVAETNSRKAGGLAADVLPLPNIFNRAIDRLAPGLNGDPEKIREKLEGNILKLASGQNRVDRAFANRFNDKAGEENFRKVISDFVKLQAETGNLQKALERLANSSEALSEIQFKLNNLKQIEQSQFNLSIRKLTADPTQRRLLERGQEIFEQVRGGGQRITDLSRNERVKLFDFVSSAGPRERNTIEQQLRKEGLGLNAQDTKDLDELLAKQTDIQTKAVEASGKLADITKNLIDIQQNKLIAAQNALTQAIIRNTNILELQRKQTQLGDIAAKQQEANKPFNELTTIKNVLGRAAGLPLAANDVVGKNAIIGEFIKIREKIEKADEILLEMRRVDKFEIGYDDTETFKKLKKLFDGSEGNDFTQKRENFVSKVADSFGISKKAASEIIPQFKDNNTDRFLRNTTSNFGDFFGTGEGRITDADRKTFADKRAALNAAGIGGVSTLKLEDLKTLNTSIEAFNKFGKSVDDVTKTVNDLADSFKKLKAEIDKNPESQKGRQVEGFKALFEVLNIAGLRGFGALKGFANGGIVSNNSPEFNPNGPDNIPAMLNKGEAVIPADVVRKNKAIINKLLRNDNSLANNIRKKSPLGSLARFAADTSLGIPNDRLLAFGSDTYGTKSLAFNEESALLNASTKNRPGIRDQYALNASILKDSTSRVLATAQDLYYSQAKKDYGTNKIFNPDSPQRQVNNAIADAAQNKLAQNIQNLNAGIDNFGKHIAALNEALNKQIRIDGEQNVNVNVVGLANKDTSDIKDLVVNTVKEKLGDLFPNFI